MTAVAIFATVGGLGISMILLDLLTIKGDPFSNQNFSGLTVVGVPILVLGIVGMAVLYLSSLIS